MNRETIDDWLFSIGRGDVPPQMSSVDPDAFLRRVDTHGAAGRVAAAMDELSPQIATGILRRLVGQLAFEEAHARLLAELVGAFAAAGIPHVLIKGSGLAYSVYDDPSHRARGDTDLLVLPRDVDAARRLLARAGFEEVLSSAMGPLWTQASFERADILATHSIDLHWALSNSPMIARSFPPDELMRRSVALPRLALAARGTDLVDALLVAAVHRAQHLAAPYSTHGVSETMADRLIWLNDIDLIAARLSPAEWEEVLGRAEAKGIESVLVDALRAARRRLGTAVPDGVMAPLAASRRPDRVARYTRASRLHRVALDLAALPGWRLRANAIRATLFPPAQYMYARAGGRRITWLPWLYLSRALAGVAALRRPR